MKLQLIREAMDRCFHFAPNQIRCWAFNQSVSISVLISAQGSDLHVALHVWLLQLQTRNILFRAMRRYCEKAIRAWLTPADAVGCDWAIVVAKFLSFFFFPWEAQTKLVCKNSNRVTCLWLTRSLEDAWKVFFFFFGVQSASGVSILALFFCHVKNCKKQK